MVAVKCVGGVKLHNASQLSTRDRLVFCFFFSVCSLEIEKETLTAITNFKGGVCRV